MTWRDDLPPVGDRRLAVRATADAVRQVRGGSPWLFDGSITSVTGGADDGPRAGDLAVLFDDRRRFAAIGLFDPDSPIRVKVLHAGDPLQIDGDWWRHRFTAAIDRREALAADGTTTAYRLVHGENDGLPALVVDRYGDTLVVKVYSAAWFPHLGTVVDTLVSLAAPARVVLRLSRELAARAPGALGDGVTLVGTPPDGPIRFQERGLRMEADVVRGQKTGHFLDQRDNRMLVRGMASGCDVLDVFASTGGFSLAAAAGGARSVHLVDQSAPALETARRNLEHNERLREVRACTVRTSVGDAFDVLAALGRDANARFDLVVIDPPSFAHNRAAVERALHAYGRLTRLGLAVLRPRGVLVQASCSSRVDAESFFETVHDSARRAGRPLHELRRTGHAVDHPVTFEQGAYLKALFART